MFIHEAAQKAMELNACIVRPGMKSDARIKVHDDPVQGWLYVVGLGPGKVKVYSKWIARPEDILSGEWKVIDNFGKVYLAE